MVAGRGADTVDKVVDHFAQRFLSVPLRRRTATCSSTFLAASSARRVQPGDTLEDSLRELLYLVLSTPEYQLG
jgi:hypothetical protein